jgi:uncharacterized protein (TIGR02453 family)
MVKEPSRAVFEGFPPDAWEFYQDLAAENTREFWVAHRELYEISVVAPLTALIGELTSEFGPFKVFRPHRDVRFSKDKAPYKTHQGAVTEGAGGEFYYFQLSGTGLFVASGHHQMASDQLERFRVAVDNDRSGKELVLLVDALEPKFLIGGRVLSTAPRGYRRDHPRVRFLQHKGLTAGKDFGTPKWLSSRNALARIAETWRAAAHLNEWLNKHVGPSHNPPDRRSS